jgi:hypothetical protein
LNDANDLKRDRPDVARATHLLSRDEARRIVNIAKLPELFRRGQFGVQTQSYRRYFSSMIEKTPRARRMSEKELRARIDRVIAEEERTYGRLIELRDLFRAITGELDSSTASLPNISNIVATPSRFRRSKP